MKKYIWILLLLAQWSHAATKDSLANYYKRIFHQSALYEDDFCDACGCSASGGSMGFASMLNANFVGVRYFNQRYATTDGLYTNSAWYSEKFNTVQAWARIPIIENVQLSVLVPYHFHERDTEKGLQSISGLGDITLMGMYRVYQTKKDSTVFVHTLQLGGGVKIPSGSFDQANSGSVNPSFQLGTGSWDYLFNAEYTIKRKRFGLSTLMNYVVKSENAKSYRFGNQFNYAGTLFYVYEDENEFSIAPQLGLAGEVYAANHQYQEKIRFTEGDVLFGKIGVELGKKRFSFGTNFLMPVTQHLSGGRVEAKNRWSINLNYSL